MKHQLLLNIHRNSVYDCEPENIVKNPAEMMDFIEHLNYRGNHAPMKQPNNFFPLSSPLQDVTPNSQQNPAIINRDEVDNRGSSTLDYRFESTRRESFRNWPVPYMDKDKLASAGFYYTGESDRVKCFECGVEIFQWVEGDNPMSDHQRWSFNCRFVRKVPCGNVPVGVDPATVPTPTARSRDVCGTYGEDFRPNASPDFRTSQKEFTYPSTATLGSLGLAKPKGPRHPEYASYDARLKTFDTWPKSMPQTKEQLADAGFYYTGTGDQTQCYHCGGGLKDWEPEDDPWEQHAKWCTKCYYLLMVKGQAYINSVIGQRVAPPTKEETMQMNLPSFIQKVEQSTSENANTVEIGEKSALEATASTSEPPQSCSQSPKEKNADDARMCKICYNEELGVVFLPCRHMVACVKCAPGMVTCAVCRERVTMTVRAIIS